MRRERSFDAQSLTGCAAYWARQSSNVVIPLGRKQAAAERNGETAIGSASSRRALERFRLIGVRYGDRPFRLNSTALDLVRNALVKATQEAGAKDDKP